MEPKDQSVASLMHVQMNLLLGLDIVPPAAIRTNVQLGDKKYDLGVMVAAVEGLRPLSGLPTRVSLPSRQMFSCQQDGQQDFPCKREENLARVSRSNQLCCACTRV